MREEYQLQLKQLHEALYEMGALCEEAIRCAIAAMVQDDAAFVPKAFTADAKIDKKEREIEALCLKLLLQQQPVASDLRDISAALKMISDMERIGDQASDIAEIAQYIIGHTNKHESDLDEMAAEAIKMVNQSVESFIHLDLKLARQVIVYDDVVDAWFDRIKKELVQKIGQDSSLGEYYMDLLMVAKYLERIADHATNIGEWVEYSITGKRSKNGVFPG